MKWIILLILLAIILVFVINRFRGQIQMAIYVFQMFRKMRSAGKTEEKQIEKREEARDVPLIRCGKCGTWIAQNKALTLGSTKYCSTACLEKSAVSR